MEMRTARRTRFQDVAQALEDRISRNEWPIDHKLPSVRALAQEYDIAAATASRAFEVLRGKGIVRPDERSGVFRVADRARSVLPEDRWAVCLRVTPGPGHRGALAVMKEGWVDPVITRNVHLDFDAFPLDLNLSTIQLRQKVEAARAAGLTGLFLMSSRLNEKLAQEDERLLEQCKKGGLAVVIVDRYLRGVHRPLEWDLVAPDYVDGGYRCAMHLLESGRRRLAFVQASPSSSHNDMLAGFLAAHGQARQRGLIPADAPFPIVYDFPEETPGPRAYSDLCAKVIGDAVDGVVCYQDRVVVGLAIELMSRNRRVPRHVALTGFDNQPIGSEFTLGVTTYALPSAPLASRAFEVMRARRANPSAPPVKVLVPSRLIVRESSVENSK
jgi:LacI family transcriptional regulator